jgi:hypothetical protein
MLFDADKAGRVAAAKVDEKLHAYSTDAPIACELLAVTRSRRGTCRPGRRSSASARRSNSTPSRRLT